MSIGSKKKGPPPPPEGMMVDLCRPEKFPDRQDLRGRSCKNVATFIVRNATTQDRHLALYACDFHMTEAVIKAVNVANDIRVRRLK